MSKKEKIKKSNLFPEERTDAIEKDLDAYIQNEVEKLKKDAGTDRKEMKEYISKFDTTTLSETLYNLE